MMFREVWCRKTWLLSKEASNPGGIHPEKVTGVEGALTIINTSEMLRFMW